MNAFIFVYGTIVTVIVGGAIGMMVWAAFEDGRQNRLDQALIAEHQSAVEEIE
jgi:hypothetical protein